jgi:hypothetical protein
MGTAARHVTCRLLSTSQRETAPESNKETTHLSVILGRAAGPYQRRIARRRTPPGLPPFRYGSATMPKVTSFLRSQVRSYRSVAASCT